MRADLGLKERQSFWETPRNIAILLAAVAAIFSALAGSIGFKLGQNPSPAATMIILPPGTSIQVPPAAKP